MFKQICDFKNLHTAYLKARSGKRYRNKILDFSQKLEENLLRLKSELESGSYQHGEYRQFIVCDSKKRQIKAAPFRDRVVHHAVCNIICDKTMNLMEKIVRSDNAELGKGIPIGNLTSQLFANIYLNELDNFTKRELQARYYLRYMDDFMILDWDKKKLRKMKEEIKKFVENKLGLKLHPKKATVSPVDKGIDFLGYVVFENYKLLRKSTVKRFIKRTRKYMKMVKQKKMSEEKFDASVASWMTYAKFGNSWRLRCRLEEKLTLRQI